MAKEKATCIALMPKDIKRVMAIGKKILPDDMFVSKSNIVRMCVRRVYKQDCEGENDP